LNIQKGSTFKSADEVISNIISYCEDRDIFVSARVFLDRTPQKVCLEFDSIELKELFESNPEDSFTSGNITYSFRKSTDQEPASFAEVCFLRETVGRGFTPEALYEIFEYIDAKGNIARPTHVYFTKASKQPRIIFKTIEDALLPVLKGGVMVGLASEQVILSASTRASRVSSFKDRLAQKNQTQTTTKSSSDVAINPKAIQEIIEKVKSEVKSEFNSRLTNLEFNQKKEELAIGFLQEGMSNLATATHHALTWAKTSNVAIDLQLEKLRQASRGKKISKEKEESLTNAYRLMNECDTKYRALHNQTYACIEDSRKITLDSPNTPKSLKRPAPLEITDVDEVSQPTNDNQDQMEVTNGDHSPSQQSDQENL